MKIVGCDLTHALPEDGSAGPGDAELVQRRLEQAHGEACSSPT